ncbi:hypothetical protein Glove_86g223 [Diversispora epigaea]|uniref:CBM1 domain-containing protein n=1 Tax=Diversispora epigaea TaxID=1348612 RepID=A0A397JAU2_9GLOM|nr:hypothetical protein Glove_86g223 [Diversispora epigaea]
MKFNTYPLLLVIFAVIASANPFNETMLKRVNCPITGTDSCCYNHGKGCYPDVAGYAWGTYCEFDKQIPVGIKCDSNYNVPVSPLFGIDGDNPGNYNWKWSESCGGEDGCACCNEYNRGGKYEWANWCEPKWTLQGKNRYCYNYEGCSDRNSDNDCCKNNVHSYICGGSPSIGYVYCYCYDNPWESCANSIGTYCWAKCDKGAPCKK